LGTIYSHSRLSNFETCPKRFHYRYVLRVPADTESIEAFTGKRVHEVLERLHHFVGDGRIPSVEKVVQRFHRLWDEHYDPERVRIARREMPADFYRRNGERCLRNFYARHYPFDADETLAVEHRVTFALDERGAYRMQGVIDRLVRARDGAIEIHDYKTSARVPSQRRLDEDRQLALYQIGVTRNGAGEHRDAAVRLVWHYLLLDQVRVSTRTAEQIEALRRETVTAIDRIEAAQEFEARPGPLCSWCEYRERCPASPHWSGEAEPQALAAEEARPAGQLGLFR
jgi:putative RecB family exonuclease